MPLFYALVARGTVVLSEHTPRSGNFSTVTRVLLGKIAPGTGARALQQGDAWGRG